MLKIQLLVNIGCDQLEYSGLLELHRLSGSVIGLIVDYEYFSRLLSLCLSEFSVALISTVPRLSVIGDGYVFVCLFVCFICNGVSDYTESSAEVIQNSGL